MGASPLGLPPAVLANGNFRHVEFASDRLVRISAFHTGEPYFGISGNNRFDAPGAASGNPQFAVCYFGTSLQLAMAESILHDEMPVEGAFHLTRSQIDDRYALYFSGDALRLLDLSGALLKRLGGSADLAGTSNYSITQQWALAVHENPAKFDGFLYMSRHLNTGRALALFDRARPKLSLTAYSPLAGARGFRAAVRKLAIELI